MGAKKKKISDIPQMDDKSLEKFWDNNQPEDFDDWEDVSFKFKRPLKKLVQLILGLLCERHIVRVSIELAVFEVC